jgi:hypothetical protein
MAMHLSVQELLPWYVKDRLSGTELARVREHLQTCRQCQSDVMWQRRLLAIDPSPEATPDVDQAFTKLLPRLAMLPQNGGQRKRELSESLGNVFRQKPARIWWALAGQAVLLIGFVIVLMPPYWNAASFRTLGMQGNSSGNAVVMFKSDTTEAEMRRILQQYGARIVDGPTASNSYVIAVPNGRQATAVDGLRLQKAVSLAESLDSGGGR